MPLQFGSSDLPMTRVVVQAFIILALPIIVFVCGAWLMSEISGREYVSQRLRVAATLADRKPLNRRLRYDIVAVKRHWDALDAIALRAEQGFLELDLIFPFLYGAALGFSLFMTWASLGRPFNLVWLLAPVIIMLLADWVETLVQLDQIKKYVTGGPTSLQEGWIQVASIATIFKSLFLGGASMLLLYLVVMLLRASKSS